MSQSLFAAMCKGGHLSTTSSLLSAKSSEPPSGARSEAERLLQNDEEQLAEDSSRGGRHAFIWNSRPCTGNALHVAVLNNNFEELSRLLEERPSLATSRFSYETSFKGVLQEGSGEAIHIAASQGSKRTVKLLLSKGASINAFVTREHLDHYNVLQAATFAEGRGGSERMVKFLLDQGADLTKNLDGRWALHLAFQTGQAALIPLIREALQEKGLVDEVEGKGAKEPTPLMVGIQMRKLSEEQLSQAAALTAESLKTFTRHEPRCVPSFLERMAGAGEISPADLATLITTEDLTKVIRESPEAAEAMLMALTDHPECESEGWHPLPSRISFAPTTIWQRIQDKLNPERKLFSLYVPDQTWKYSTTTFKAPDWHKQLTNTKLLKPIRDVDIKVCHVPNLVSADFLAAWCQVSDDDNLYVYNNNVIRCILECVWWKGAIKVDALNFVLSAWGLFLLILDLYPPLYADPDIIARGTWVSTDFIAARALVDIGHELAQFAGLAKIGHGCEYLDVGNAFDLFRVALPAMMFHDRNNRVVRILVILIYWMRILEVNFSESMAHELLPIMRLAKYLGPATVVAFIGFCALTHAYCAVENLQLGAGIISQSFSMLITGEISGGGSTDDLQMLLTHLSVLLFTVFFLNLFIGVIGENYSIQKSMSSLLFQKVRAGICSTYLLRASIIPEWLFPSCAAPLMFCAGAISLGLQLLQLVGCISVPYCSLAFAACQAVMTVSCYQSSDCPWACCRKSQPHYIWFADACRCQPPSQLDLMQQCLGELRNVLDESKLTSRRCSDATPVAPKSPGTAKWRKSASSATQLFFSSPLFPK